MRIIKNTIDAAIPAGIANIGKHMIKLENIIGTISASLVCPSAVQ